VRSIGRLAIKVEPAADSCIKTLLGLIETKVSYVVPEAIIVIKDIFRRYPGKYEGIIPTLCEHLDALEEPEAKAVPPEGTKGAVDARTAQIPPSARKEFGLGEERMQAHDSPGSIEHFQKAIAIYANYAEAYQLLGVAHLELGKAVDAEPELQKAVELEPKLATAYFALGICRNQLAKYPEAEVALAHGLELAPDSADGHYHIAEAYWNLGRFDDSEPHARKALTLNPDMAPAHVLIGNSMLRKRNAPAALQEFREYLRLAPQGEFAPGTRAAVERLEKGLQQAKPR